MVGQVAIITWQCLNAPRLVYFLSALFVLIAWVNTFCWAVPLHKAIGLDQEMHANAEKLVTINWYRTMAWSLVFILGVVDYING